MGRGKKSVQMFKSACGIPAMQSCAALELHNTVMPKWHPAGPESLPEDSSRQGSIGFLALCRTLVQSRSRLCPCLGCCRDKAHHRSLREASPLPLLPKPLHFRIAFFPGAPSSLGAACAAWVQCLCSDGPDRSTSICTSYLFYLFI